ncbi:MAG: Release factor glutamine methyltransferase [Magnetococcales bacterium]|nr:Release factor glutamine methyltransferase [Magnetococcales bacterium]
MDTPRLDAELLLADTLRLQRIGLFLDPDRPLTGDELKAFKERLKRREAREPVAYIVGQKDFWKHSFVVNCHVLIPRPETETLLECVLKHLADRRAEWHFLEVGCGSGALLISLLKEFPQATGIGLDISQQAIDISGINGQRIEVQHQVRWIQSDLLEQLPGHQSFDAIVSNPPYIARSRLPGLQPEIFLHEPHLALDGGKDGLDVLRRLVPSAFGVLKPGGLLAVEMDSCQKQEVETYFHAAGYEAVETLHDCHRVPRVVLGHRRFI